VPAPVPMLHVTPALAESLLTVAVKACAAPPRSDTVAGLTLTAMEGGVVVVVEDELPPPPPQPVSKVKVAKPHKAKSKAARTELVPQIQTGV